MRSFYHRTKRTLVARLASLIPTFVIYYSLAIKAALIESLCKFPHLPIRFQMHLMVLASITRAEMALVIKQYVIKEYGSILN